MTASDDEQQASCHLVLFHVTAVDRFAEESQAAVLEPICAACRILDGEITFVYTLCGAFVGGGVNLWAKVSEVVRLKSREILLL